MENIKKYFGDNIRLVKSLVITSLDTALHINNELIGLYGGNIVNDDKTTWKYYLNMCGEYHSVDHPIKINIIEDDSIKVLNKDTLKNYPLTRNTLLEFGDYYEDILKANSNDELLIKGMLYNVNINEAIESKDGTIVAYSNRYIEEQEYNLIPEINKYTVNFFYRWNIGQYRIIDNLYIPALLATLYTKLVLKINNIRLSNSMSSYVHSFFINEFFKSNYGIDVDVKVLSKNTQFWLYKNLKYIRKYIGQNKTLDLLIEKILTDNGISIAEVKLMNLLPDQNNINVEDIHKPIYDKRINRFISSKRNDQYLYGNTDNESSDVILMKELNSKFIDNDLIIKDAGSYNGRFNSKLDTNRLYEQKTKLFKLKKNIDDTIVHRLDFKTVLDNWFYTSFTGIFKKRTDYIDGHTGMTYSIDSKQGAFLVIKLLSKLLKLDNPVVPNYVATSIINEEVSVDYLTNGLINRKIITPVAAKLMAYKPMLNFYLNDDSFSKYIKDVNLLNSVLFNLRINSMDMLTSSAIQSMHKRFYSKKVLMFNNGDSTIDDLLLSEGLDYKFSLDYDYKETLKDIVKIFTGFDLYSEDIVDMMDKYIHLMKTMSSYTIQFMDETIVENRAHIKHSDIQSNSTPGIIDIKAATFRALEEFYGAFIAIDAHYGEFLKFDAERFMIYGKKVCNKPKLLLYHDNDLLETDVLEYSNKVPNIVFSNNACLNMYKPAVNTGTKEYNDFIKPIGNTLLTTGLIKNDGLQLTIDESQHKLIYSDSPITRYIANREVELFKPKYKGMGIATNINLDIIKTMDGITGKTIMDHTVSKLKAVGYDGINTVGTRPTVSISSNSKLMDLFKPIVGQISNDGLNKLDKHNENNVVGYYKNKETSLLMSYMTSNNIYDEFPNLIFNDKSTINLFRPVSKADSVLIKDGVAKIDILTSINGSLISSKMSTLSYNDEHALYTENRSELYINKSFSKLDMFKPKFGGSQIEDRRNALDYMEDHIPIGKIKRFEELRTIIECIDDELNYICRPTMNRMDDSNYKMFSPMFKHSITTDEEEDINNTHTAFTHGKVNNKSMQMLFESMNDDLRSDNNQGVKLSTNVALDIFKPSINDAVVVKDIIHNDRDATDNVVGEINVNGAKLVVYSNDTIKDAEGANKPTLINDGKVANANLFTPTIKSNNGISEDKLIKINEIEENITGIVNTSEYDIIMYSNDKHDTDTVSDDKTPNTVIADGKTDKSE